MSTAAEKNNTGRSKYKCGICGQTKKGHICQAVGGAMCVTPPLANPAAPSMPPRRLDVVAAAACSMYVISCAAWGSISTPPRSQSAGRPVRSRDVDGGADRWLCWVCRASQGDEDVSHERCVPGHPLPAGASSSGDANTARVFSREI